MDQLTKRGTYKKRNGVGQYQGALKMGGQVKVRTNFGQWVDMAPLRNNPPEPERKHR